MRWMDYMQETAFGANTRQQFRPLNQTLTYAVGSRDQQPFSRVGYLARVHLHFSGTLTVTLGGGTAALDTLGPWNSVSRVRILANSGQDIYSVSGYGSYILNTGFITGDAYEPTSSGVGPTSYATRVYAAATASGANTWDWGLTIPVALNESSELGLILLQNEMAQTSFALEYASNVYSLTAAQAPVLVTGAATATLTGTFTPTVEYFAVPADPNARPDISWLHQCLEFTSPIAATGDNIVNLVRDNLYVDLIHHVVINNAPDATNIDRLRLLINQSDTPYDFTNKALLQEQRKRFKRDMPAGVFSYPLFYQGMAAFGDERDLVNGRATSELQSLLTVNSGATLGTNSRIATITRQLVKLTTPTTNPA